MKKTFFRIKELSEYTGYSENYLYQLTRHKKIPHIKKGGVFFDKEEIDKWLRSFAVAVSEEQKESEVSEKSQTSKNYLL